MTSPVLVTGGTGRLGRSVVAQLVDAGHDVRVLARRQRDAQPQVTFFTGDLRRERGHRRGRAWRRGGPLHSRDQHEGRREGDNEPGDRGGQGRLALRAAIHRRHRLHGAVGVCEDQARGRAESLEQRPAVDDPAGDPVLQLLLREFPEASEVPAGGASAQGFPCAAGRFPRGRGAARRARARRARRGAPDMSGPEISSWKDLFGSHLAAAHQRKLVVPMLVPGSKAVRTALCSRRRATPKGPGPGTSSWPRNCRSSAAGWTPPRGSTAPESSLHRTALSASPDRLGTNDLDSRRSTPVEARMKSPAIIIPDAMTAIRSLNEAVQQGAVPQRTLDPGAPANQPDQRLQRLPGRGGQGQGKTARQTNGSSHCPPGGIPRTSATPSAPPWPSPKPSPGSATGPIPYLTRSGRGRPALRRKANGRTGLVDRHRERLQPRQRRHQASPRRMGPREARIAPLGTPSGGTARC